MRDRFCKERQPKGDPDCRVGVKKSTNVEHPDPRVAQRDAKEKEKGFADTFEAGLGFV
jgi:hypothetical protein